VCPNGPNSTAACVSGSCTIVCNQGFGDCDNNPANGCEVNLQNNTSNCGFCGNTCSEANGTPSCAGGACQVAVCNSGFADCDQNPSNGCEINTRIDPNNCGSCGTECSAANGTSSCTNGTCSISSCASGYANCDNQAFNGCEVHIAVDPNNCGSCGHACSGLNVAAETCTAGSCGIAACAAGYADCNLVPSDGCEINITNDTHNCGGCGIQCPNGKTCTAGACH
jgi:hypothetical protein